MAISVKKTNEKETAIDFEVTLGAADFEKELSKWHAAKALTVRLDGFRPGKVPLAVVKARYGEEAKVAVANDLIDKASRLIDADHKITPADKPKVNVAKSSEKDGFECVISYEFFPQVTLKDFGGIKCEELLLKISEKEIDDALERLLKNHKSFAKEAKAGAADWGDKVSFSIAEKGAPATAEEKTVVLEKEATGYLADLGKALHAKSAGETAVAEINFPRNYPDRHLAGKTATCSIRVISVREPAKAKLDDNFAKELECADLNDLREKTRGLLRADNGRALNLYHKRQILDALDADYDFALPESIVEKEFQTIWKKLRSEMAEAKRKGESDEDFDLKTAEKEYRAIAKRRVKLGYIISEIARIHEITLTEDEVKQTVIREALKYNNFAQKIFDFYAKNHGALGQLTAPVLEDKVINFALSRSTKTQTEITAEELHEKLKGVVPGYDDEDGEIGDVLEDEALGTEEPDTTTEKPEKTDSKQKDQ